MEEFRRSESNIFKQVKNVKGITLIALVVTIVILLILAGITINYVFSEGGLFDTAKNSGNTWHDAENSDLNALNELNGAIGNLANGTVSSGTTTPAEPEDTTLPEEASFGEFSKTNPEPNETITVSVTLGDEGSDINITSCKYIYDTTSSNLGTTNSAWESARTFTTNPENIELTASIEGTYYLHILSVDNAGNKTESISSAITVAASGPKLKSADGSTTEPLTEATYGQYLGRAVKYTPANPSTEYGTSTTYRIFYIDFAEKYGEKGTVYLKADCDANNGNLNSYTSYASTDNYVAMKALNPAMKATLNPETMQISDYCVSWILDPNVWTNWKDETTAGIKENINYVVGAPSLEMYVDSYNKYLDTHEGLVKNGGTNSAQKLACEYTTDTTTYPARGYRIGFEGETSTSWAGTGYHQNDNSLISVAEANGMYNPGSNKWYWIASPSANNSNGVMHVEGNGSRVAVGSYEYSYTFCPIVSLKSSVQLELAD